MRGMRVHTIACVRLRDAPRSACDAQAVSRVQRTLFMRFQIILFFLSFFLFISFYFFSIFYFFIEAAPRGAP